MTVQTTYSESMAAAKAGMPANAIPFDADSRICETAAGIAFGVAVGAGSADNGCVVGKGSGKGFVGVTIRDVTLDPADEDTYQQYAAVGVMTKGDIWVTTGGNVVDGGIVTFNNTTGVLSATAADGSNTLVTGARWMTTASSGELARLRLTGPLAAS